MKYPLTFTEEPSHILYGLRMQSNDRTQHHDIPALSKRFYDESGTSPGSVLPFYVVSKDYHRDTGDFVLFIGSVAKCGPERETIPAGCYARLTVRPRFRFLWGFSVGKAKRWFYTRWLPSSNYEAINLEYELHTKKTIEKHPAAELFFAIRRKTDEII